MEEHIPVFVLNGYENMSLFQVNLPTVYTLASQLTNQPATSPLFIVNGYENMSLFQVNCPTISTLASQLTNQLAPRRCL